MSKLLALVALVLLAWMLLRRARTLFLTSPRGQEVLAIWRLLRQAGATTGPRSVNRSAGSAGAASPRGGGSDAAAAAGSILLIRCATCGAYMPEERVRRDAGGVYCSDACQQRAVR